MTSTQELIFPEVIRKAYTYEEYEQLIESLLEKGKTTGENHSEVMLHYTTMNIYRMRRHDKHAELKSELKEKLQNLNKQFLWLTITEGWCGDAAQNLPIINKMAEETPNIELRLILRDQHRDIMNEFLTDGKSRSIPKLICLDAELYEVVGTWGPRPQTAQEMALQFKNMNDINQKEAAEQLHKWYAENENEEIQQEFLELLDEWDDI